MHRDWFSQLTGLNAKPEISGERLRTFEFADCILIAFDHPDGMNAFDLTTANDAVKIRPELLRLRPRTVFFTGSGKVFSAGGDHRLLESLTKNSPGHNRKLLRRFYLPIIELLSLPFPLVSLVNGHAAGAGFTFAMGCDVQYFVPGIRTGVNFTKIGLPPGLASEAILNEKLPASVAVELLVRGRITTIEQSPVFRHVNVLNSADMLPDIFREISDDAAHTSPFAVRTALAHFRNKDVLRKRRLCMEQEILAQSSAFRNPEISEAITAFRARETYYFRF